MKQSLSSLDFNFSNYIFEESLVYSDFNGTLNSLNAKIQQIITKLNNLKDKMMDLLLEKEKSTFKDFTNKKINMDDFIDKDEFSNLKDDCDNLVQKNNAYTTNIDRKKEDAKKHLINNELVIFKTEYEEFKRKIDSKEEELEKKEKIKNEFDSQIDQLKKERVEKSKETKNEQLAADFINNYLKDYFKLEKIPNKHNYIVKNIDGTTRPVSTLSKGEKNIVAFLWFIKNLENIELNSSDKKKIIIFDDPMDSNDDVMQYIMLSELRKLTDLFTKKDNTNANNIVQLFIFTHNAHFYMNVKESCPHRRNKNYKAFILRKNDQITIEKVTKNNDIKQNYDTLWQDAMWLYANGKTNLLLNNFRRIIESYITFNKIDKKEFYSKVGRPDFQKLLDTNSHFVSEEMDSNPCNRSVLKDEFKEIFNKYDDLQHFNNHWNEELVKKYEEGL